MSTFYWTPWLLVFKACLFGLLVSFAAQSLVAQTAEQVVAESISARGGAEAFAKVESIRVTGKIKLGDNEAGAITVIAQRPSSFRADITIGPDQITESYDGTTGWRQINGKHKLAASALSGPELDKLIDQAVNAIGGPMVEHSARGNQFELAGHQTIGDKDCLKIKLTLRTGSLVYEYIDASSHLEIREDLTVPGDGKAVTVEQTVGDYRRFGEILFACLFVSSGERLEISNVEINPKLDKALFALPRP